VANSSPYLLISHFLIFFAFKQTSLGQKRVKIK
jgi:hypothetical protein